MRMTYQQKLQYLQTSLLKKLLNRGYTCPSCGGESSRLVSRKYLVTELRRCDACRVMYRAPTTSGMEFEKFYQSEYSEGFTTDMPSASELNALLTRNFKDTEKDYSTYISILSSLGYPSGSSLLDYGCSWGYGSWQLSRAGFKVVGFEISRPRCDFAVKNLEVDAHSDLSKVQGRFDIFFSSHVLEHIPKLEEVIDIARRYVKPGGHFIAITPNGSEAFRRTNPDVWQKTWGAVHPLCLDDEYYGSRFAEYPHIIDSSPYDLAAIQTWAKTARGAFVSNRLRSDGAELLVVVRL